jgi:uncharacterized membrane protein
MEKTTLNEDKTIAVIAYLTIFGTIAAFAINYKKQNFFTKFHIRQMFGIFILLMINSYFIFNLVGRFFGGFIFIGIVFLWFIGIKGALNGKEKQIPFFGKYFQSWFRFI